MRRTLIEWPEGKAEHWTINLDKRRLGLRIEVQLWKTGYKSGAADLSLISGDGRTVYFQRFATASCTESGIDAEIERLTELAKTVRICGEKEAKRWAKEFVHYLADPSAALQAWLKELYQLNPRACQYELIKLLEKETGKGSPVLAVLIQHILS